MKTERDCIDLKLTTIMVTHDPRDAQIASDMTAFIAEGCVQQAGLTQHVFASPGPALRSYLGIN
ncbi:MAG: hypothetical protein JKY10_05510 [Cohaesibacteraceae bacterium]|nr:hypothetical protein [Cohaesibacteraceae bacterium]